MNFTGQWLKFTTYTEKSCLEYKQTNKKYILSGVIQLINYLFQDIPRYLCWAHSSELSRVILASSQKWAPLLPWCYPWGLSNSLRFEKTLANSSRMQVEDLFSILQGKPSGPADSSILGSTSVWTLCPFGLLDSHYNLALPQAAVYNGDYLSLQGGA